MTSKPRRPKIRKALLLKLADLLEKLPRKRFRYAQWVGDDWKGKADLSCGTAACALGWATTMPEARKLGLRMRMGANGLGYVARLGQRLGQDEDDLDQLHSSLEAAAVFGLTYREAQWLFVPSLDGLTSPGVNATAKTVAKHIRTFVEKGIPEEGRDSA